VEVVVLVIEADEVAVVDLQILVETGVVMATLKRVVEEVAGNGIVVVEEVMEADPGLTLVEKEDTSLMNLKNPLQVRMSQVLTARWKMCVLRLCYFACQLNFLVHSEHY